MYMPMSLTMNNEPRLQARSQADWGRWLASYCNQRRVAAVLKCSNCKCMSQGATSCLRKKVFPQQRPVLPSRVYRPELIFSNLLNLPKAKSCDQLGDATRKACEHQAARQVCVSEMPNQRECGTRKLHSVVRCRASIGARVSVSLGYDFLPPRNVAEFNVDEEHRRIAGDGARSAVDHKKRVAQALNERSLTSNWQSRGLDQMVDEHFVNVYQGAVWAVRCRSARHSVCSFRTLAVHVGCGKQVGPYSAHLSSISSIESFDLNTYETLGKINSG